MSLPSQAARSSKWFSSFRFLCLLNPRRSFPLRLNPMAWVCSKCTFINSSSQKSICQICLAPSPSLSPSSSSSAASAVARWSCKACTYLNPYGKSNCEICGTRAIISSLSGFEDLNSTSPDDELDASVGSVFLPLQPCKRKKPDSVEIVVAEPCGFRGGKASATTATVLGESILVKEAF